jgi:hypothetical protein
VGRGGHDRRLGRHPGLDEDPARAVSAPGAAGHLDEELERALGRPEVGQVESGVGRHHADQRHARQVESLGDHLRAHQDVDLPVLHGPVDPRVRPLGHRRVDVHACDARLGEQIAHGALHLLGPQPAGVQAMALAAGAGIRHRISVPAIVAEQPGRVAMNRERDPAVRALRHPAAVEALDVGREAAPVEEEQRLVARRQRLGQRPGEAGRVDVAAGAAQHVAVKEQDFHKPPPAPRERSDR